MTKYQEYFQRMMQTNQGLFDSFRQIHDQYGMDEDKYQGEFNKEGEKVLLVVREWENKLCSQSEKGGFGKFTTGLAEKFQAEVRRVFPLIDHVGIVVKDNKQNEAVFSLRKINLS